MASIPGGPAEKLGNEFERLWGVRQVLDILAGNLRNIQIEPLGIDSRGTEFWVAKADGTREAHQCKRENGSAGKWSIADLQRESIITDAQFHLQRDPTYRYVFASADKAPHLSDLVERATQYSDPQKFLDATRTSSRHREEFENLCRLLNYDPTHATDVGSVIDFLTRVQPIVIDKFRQRGDVEIHAAHLISGGEPRDVVHDLESLVTSSIGKTLTEIEVVEHLKKSGFRRSDLSRDPTLIQRITDLRDRFTRSFKDRLIAGSPLVRVETAQLYSALMAIEGTRLILVHGAGGDGKSGVVYELVERLIKDNILCLPLSLDHDKPGNSPNEYGKALELPASPAVCLVNAAAGQPATLLLDQTDAIRWTASHTSHAWDTCLRLIEETAPHRNIRVVLVCRSFDLEDDPKIKAWKNEKRPFEIEVKPLDEKFRDAFLLARNISPSSIDKRQLDLLRSPQTLYLWNELRIEQGHVPSFQTTTDLMRAFWDMVRRRKLPHLKAGNYDVVLEAIVDYADNNGVLYAPELLVSRWPEEIAALISLNLLSGPHSERLFFAHQSYLDYLTAEQALLKLFTEGKSVQDWLKQRDQSLFRRGQLRQLLALLRDQDPPKYKLAISELLNADGIRFHIRHLVLQMLGYVDIPSDEEVDVIAALLKKESWIDHIFSQVLARRVAWFDALYQKEILRTWFASQQTLYRNLALNVMEGVVSVRAEKLQELVFRQRPRRIELLQAILWRGDLAMLSDGLFRAYLGLTRAGSKITEYIDWKSIGEKNPTRCLQLFKVVVNRKLLELMKANEEKTRVAQDHSFDTAEIQASLSHAAASDPSTTWDTLIPLLRFCTRIRQKASEQYRKSIADQDTNTESSITPDFYSYYDIRRRLGRIRDLLSRLLIVSGESLAKNSQEQFWQKVKALANDRSAAVNRVLALSMQEVPMDEADRALAWLLSLSVRLHCGGVRSSSRLKASRYHPARQLLARFAGHCSQSVFAKVERAVLSHRPGWELEDFRYCHKIFMGISWSGETTKGRIYKRNLFLGQYLLFSALPKKRLHTKNRDWLGVLRRKFGPTKHLLHEPPSSMGGSVSSPIPHERLHLVSDQQWLDIVSRDWSAYGHRWKMMAKGIIAEATPEAFAGSLAGVARRQPQRICKLLLRFPMDVAEKYVTDIVRTFAETAPPQNSPEFASWLPVSAGDIEKVLDKYQERLNSRVFVGALTWIIQRRPDEPWSDPTLKRLTDIAINNEDPHANEYSVHSVSKESGRQSIGESDPVSTAINCARGEAAGAIEAVLYNHKDKLQIFLPALQSLSVDLHPAVRIAAIGVAVPLLNYEKDEAITFFLKACDHADDNVLRSHDINRFLSYTLLRHLDRLEQLLMRMVNSAIDAVAKQGAEWVALTWIHTRKLEQTLRDSAVSSRKDIREGVATIMASQFADGRANEAAQQLLQSFFNDPHEDVRAAAASVFRYPRSFGIAGAVLLTERFVESAAFEKHFDLFVMALAGLTIPLRPFAKIVTRMVNRIGEISSNGANPRVFHLEALPKALLRLYEQSDNDLETRSICLDTLDVMLEKRLRYDLPKELEM